MYFFGKQFFRDDDNLTNQSECVVFATNQEQDDLAPYARFPALSKIRLSFVSSIVFFCICYYWEDVNISVLFSKAPETLQACKAIVCV